MLVTRVTVVPPVGGILGNVFARLYLEGREISYMSTRNFPAIAEPMVMGGWLGIEADQVRIGGRDINVAGIQTVVEGPEGKIVVDAPGLGTTDTWQDLVLAPTPVLIEAPLGIPVWGWVLGGAAALGLVYAATRKK